MHVLRGSREACSRDHVDAGHRALLGPVQRDARCVTDLRQLHRKIGSPILLRYMQTDRMPEALDSRASTATKCKVMMAYTVPGRRHP